MGCDCWLIIALKLLRLRGLPFKGINILSADVTQRQRRPVRRPAKPGPPHIGSGPEVFQTCHPFQFPVANLQPIKSYISLAVADKVEVFPISRPMRTADILID